MKAVLYGSHYGHTQKYAEAIARALGCEAFPANKHKEANIEGCDTVVFGGGLYAGGIAGWSKVSPYCAKAQGQRWVLFTCGLADPALEKTQKESREIFERRLPEALRGRLPVFCLRGGMDYAALGLKHRAMMAMLAQYLRRQKERSAQDEQLLATYGKRIEFFDEATIEPVVRAARGEN